MRNGIDGERVGAALVSTRCRPCWARDARSRDERLSFENYLSVVYSICVGSSAGVSVVMKETRNRCDSETRESPEKICSERASPRRRPHIARDDRLISRIVHNLYFMTVVY